MQKALLPFLLFCISAQAQPVLSFQDIDLAPRTYDLHIAPSLGSGSAIGIDGAKCQWVFAPPSFESTYAGSQLLDPADTPFGDEHPNSNWAQMLAMPSGTVYNYMEAGPSGLKLWAKNITADDGITYTFPSTRIYFPLEYDGLFPDNYVIDNSNYSALRQYSGYGTMTTPVGVFTDVVKIIDFNGNMDFYTTNPITPLLHYRPLEPIIFFSPTLVGIGERSATGTVDVFPNPTADVLWVGDAPQGGSWYLLDLQGRLVLSGTTTPGMHITLEGLASGSYLLQVHEQGSMRRATVVKQ